MTTAPLLGTCFIHLLYKVFPKKEKEPFSKSHSKRPIPLKNSSLCFCLNLFLTLSSVRNYFYYSTMCAFLVPFKSYHSSGKKNKTAGPSKVYITRERHKNKLNFLIGKDPFDFFLHNLALAILYPYLKFHNLMSFLFFFLKKINWRAIVSSFCRVEMRSMRCLWTTPIR